MQKILILSLTLFMAYCTGSNKSLQAIENTAIVSEKTTTMPSKEAFQASVNEAYNKFKKINTGKNADYIPYLAKADSSLFAVAIVTAKGEIYTAGDITHTFPIQSVSKPFVLSLAMSQSGDQAIVEKIGVEPTGLQFNSVTALELLNEKDHKPAGNPLVNAGAIATTSIIKAKSPEDRWNQILNHLSDYAGEHLSLNKDVYESEAATNQHNRGIAELLKSYDRLYSDPTEAVDVYTMQCSIDITAKQLAVMGATLANGGINPITKKKVIDPIYVPKLLAVMMMGGFYDESGAWAWQTGVPSKTGVGGGIVAIVPGKYAIVGFSSKLNTAGNSVRASKAIEYIVDKLNANIFLS